MCNASASETKQCQIRHGALARLEAHCCNLLCSLRRSQPTRQEPRPYVVVISWSGNDVVGCHGYIDNPAAVAGWATNTEAKRRASMEIIEWNARAVMTARDRLRHISQRDDVLQVVLKATLVFAELAETSPALKREYLDLDTSIPIYGASPQETGGPASAKNPEDPFDNKTREEELAAVARIAALEPKRQILLEKKKTLILSSHSPGHDEGRAKGHADDVAGHSHGNHQRPG